MSQHIRMLVSAIALAVSSMASNAAVVSYDSGLNEWSVTGWICGACSAPGSGAFAPGTFTGYTSTNGVAMLRNIQSGGWWIGDVQVSTFSSFYEDDSVTLDVVGATWGGTVNYFTNQAVGSNFYAASNGAITDLTGLALGAQVNGTFSWGGTLDAPTLTYTASNSAVPVPATLALVGIAFVGLGLARQRKAVG